MTARRGTNCRGTNSHWAQLMVEELARCGCRYFVISPGSRSTPLVVAAARHPSVTASVCIDERGAAFHAVGHARATGSPAALVCTSGTALANYLPAAVEAAQDQVPLLVLSADRPPELHDTGANQTILQRGMFGQYARWSTELPVPTPHVDPRVVLTTIDQAVLRCTTDPAGPVHVNVPFGEPLEPGPIPQPLLEGAQGRRWCTTEEPFTVYRSTPGEVAVSELASVVAQSSRGLLVAGAMAHGAGAAVEALAGHLGWPLLGDAVSGARGNAGAQLLLQSPAGRRTLRPDTVLHFGSHVVAKHYLTLLQETAPRLVQIAPGPRRLDPSHSAALRIAAEPGRVARALTAQCPPRDPSAYAGAVGQAGARAAAAVAGWADEQQGMTEPMVARLAAAAAAGPPRAGLFAASSMPIRDLDTFATPLPAGVAVAANRGASGIDGAVASAAGFAAGLRRPVVALLGDLSLLHDLPSLSQLGASRHGLVIVVVNNRGGGIFSLLPLARVDEPGFHALFERYFATRHEIGFEPVAAGFALHYRRPETPAHLERCLAAAVHRAAGGDSTLLEVVTDRGSNAAVHRELSLRTERAVVAGRG
ncbi:MAG: 2-succinyl-5-enolpyruvyl-6-hydroxy-3-cyclohexene-1-carboxylic-acid synthase [Spirochaetaceae bacterium]|nr:2-succinyl-5-enolpyruvyl-6-hydroxy-3-cyclohexene-1-carboxylic-acid synthase [Spirochaetaceae bacterium]